MHTHTEREQEEKFKIPCKDMQRMLSCVRLFATPWTHEAPLSRNFSGKNIRVGCHFLLQGIFLTQVSNQRLLCLLHWQADSLPLCHLGNVFVNSCLVYPPFKFKIYFYDPFSNFPWLWKQLASLRIELLNLFPLSCFILFSFDI